jgi:hypothetical protein
LVNAVPHPFEATLQNSVRAELVEALSFFGRKEMAFDKLRPNGWF